MKDFLISFVDFCKTTSFSKHISLQEVGKHAKNLKRLRKKSLCKQNFGSNTATEIDLGFGFH